MRAVIQRVSKASVRVEGQVCGAIEGGLVVFLGVRRGDTEEDLAWLAAKIVKLRVFEDDAGKMNASVKDVAGGVLLISQFTLFGNIKKGTRPSFNRAAPPEEAIPLYEKAKVVLSHELGKPVACGVFGAMMDIEAHNDGPVTIILDTKERDF